MRAVVVFVILAGSAIAAPLRFVAPGLRVTNLKTSLAQDFTDHLAQQLVGRGVAVITSTDVQAVLSVERQKQLLGCSDDASSCMTELAGALGADGVVTGTVVRIGKKFQVNVRIVDARDAKPLALFSEQAEKEEDLFAVLDLAAQKLVNDLAPLIAARARQAKAEPPQATVEPVDTIAVTRPGARRFWWAPAGAAGLFGIASVVFFVQRGAVLSQLESKDSVPTDFPLSATIARGRTYETLAWVSVGLTGASVAALGALLLLGDDQPVVSLVPHQGGASLVVGGSF